MRRCHEAGTRRTRKRDASCNPTLAVPGRQPLVTRDPVSQLSSEQLWGTGKPSSGLQQPPKKEPGRGETHQPWWASHLEQTGQERGIPTAPLGAACPPPAPSSPIKAPQPPRGPAAPGQGQSSEGSAFPPRPPRGKPPDPPESPRPAVPARLSPARHGSGAGCGEGLWLPRSSRPAGLGSSKPKSQKPAGDGEPRASSSQGPPLRAPRQPRCPLSASPRRPSPSWRVPQPHSLLGLCPLPFTTFLPRLLSPKSRLPLPAPRLPSQSGAGCQAPLGIAACGEAPGHAGFLFSLHLISCLRQALAPAVLISSPLLLPKTAEVCTGAGSRSRAWLCRFGAVLSAGTHQFPSLQGAVSGPQNPNRGCQPQQHLPPPQKSPLEIFGRLKLSA